MDSSRFIRRRSVFAAWILIPLALIALVDMASRNVQERLRITFDQQQTLDRLIPQMAEAAEQFDVFIAPYISAKGKLTSVENVSIDLINQSAGSASVTITSINLSQDPVDKKTGTHRINIHIKGEGTAQSLAAFIKNIKINDPFIHEDQVLISRVRRHESRFLLETTLYKIYIERTGGAL